MRKFKLFLSLLMVMLLSIGQMWADATFTSSSEDATSAKNGISLSVTSGSLASGNYYRIDKGATLTISSTSGNIESIVFTCTTAAYAQLASHNPAGTYSESGTTVSWSGSANEVTFTAKTGSSNKNFRFSQVVITTAAGEDPTITLKQSNTAISKLDVAATSVANQAIDLEYANFTGSISSVTAKLYEESTCETEITSGAWVTDITINAAKTQLTFNVADNDGAARQVWLKVSATDGTGNASAVLNIKQAKYEAPFTGEVLEITKDDFASGSYAANDGGITVEGFDFAVKDMYKNSNIIQAKASSGYIYNESILGEIVKIEITKSGAANNNFTVYEGTSEHPLTTSVSGDVDGTTTTYEFSEDQTYFTLKNGSTYSTVNPIKIYYYPIKSAVTIDNSIENGSVGVTGAADLTQVAAGTVLTLSNTPDASYKLTAYDVYKTGEATTKVTVTDGKFTMPAYAVTVSGSFELARDLTSIAISAEASKKTYLVDETFSSEGLEITASFSNAADAVVTPTSISSPDMSTAGVKTITISYTEGANTETTSYDITVKDAYTVTEILPLVPAQNAGSLATKVKGYISQIDQYNSTYKSITYWISVDGKTTSDQLEVYSGKNVGNTNFSSIDDLAVGDFVTISGSVKTHTNGVKEFDKNNYIITGGRIQKGAVTSVAVSGNATKTTYSANETFETAGLVVTATYANGFSEVVTEGITWGNDLTDNKVTENTTVHVTATVSGITNDPAYDVPVTVAAKTLVSIAVGTASYTIYTGEALPQPVVTATFSEGEPEDVSAFAVYDSESVFDTEVIDNPDPQTITVSYTFGGETKTTTYTVSVQDYENANDAPYSVTEALHIITAAIGNVESAREIVVTGTVSVENISSNKNRYKISDGVNELLVYAGKGFESVEFTNTNYPKVGDVVIVKGKVINFQGNTPEFASGKSYLLSQVRPTTLAIEDIASFEVGATDLTESDLDITTPSDGDITFVSGDETKATIVSNVAIHAVAPGTVTITANLAATENVDALNYAAASTTFSVTVVAPATKYTITFDGNGATGGSAPTAIEDKAEGDNVTLPANSYTKTGYTFNGWKVYDENEVEVTVTANAFTMPASDVVIKAQWAELPVWAYTYTSNVTIASNEEKQVTIDGDDYPAAKSNKGTSATITLPQGVTKIHLHLVAWKSEAQTVTVSGACFNEDKELTILANDAVAGTVAKYDLGESGVDYYFSLTPDNAVAANEVITITAASNKRFVLFGVNQEGGVLPVLDHIAITGTMTNTTGWKTGDEITPEGLTVNAYYTLNEVMQDPVNVTNDPALVWSHAALVEDQTEVTLTATYTDGVAKSANVNVTIEAVETGDPTIITDPASYLNFGASVEKDAVVAPKAITVTLKNIAGATATLGGTNFSAFSIDDTEIVDGDVITVSVNTGTPGVYAGTVTIKDNDSETEKVINLSMTVVEPETPEIAVSTTSKWVVATAADLVDGAEVLITGVKDDVTYAMGGQNKNNRAAVAASVDGEDVLTPGENTMSFTLVAQETEGVFALRTSNGKYLYAAASGDNHMKTQNEVDVNAQWTISATSAVAESSSNRNVMQFNGGSSLFSCYNTASQSAIQFYVPKPVTPEPPVVDYTEVRNGLTEGWYYTMCLDKAVTAVKAGSIWRVLSKAANGNDVILEEVTGTLDAGRPYIFRAAASTLEVAYTGDAVGAPVTEGNNGLVGSFTEEPLAQNSNHYIIYNNALYYVNSDNVKVGAHRAYLDMTDVPAYSNEPQQGNAPRRRVTMAVHGPQVATDIDALNASEAPVKVLINGELFIIRGEKMFDAKGQLVK